MSARYTKARNSTPARADMCSRTISAMDRAWWRTEPTRAAKSCMAPMKMQPMTIHRMAGTHPKYSAAAIGPTMGPAAEMAEKCWLSRYSFGVGTKSTPSSWARAGVVACGSSA
jgi:hypothetical protein